MFYLSNQVLFFSNFPPNLFKLFKFKFLIVIMLLFALYVNYVLQIMHRENKYPFFLLSRNIQEVFNEFYKFHVGLLVRTLSFHLLETCLMMLYLNIFFYPMDIKKYYLYQFIIIYIIDNKYDHIMVELKVFYE